MLKNENYDPHPIGALSQLSEWVHVRPHILSQGRIVWFDEKKARKERDKTFARMLRALILEEMGEEEEEEAEEEGEVEGEGEEEEDFVIPERGPPILSPLHYDVSDEYTVPWTSRFTSRFTDKSERMIVLRSNIWPGSYTFAFEKLVESVYMGWGHKYTSRNMDFKHLPSVELEYPHEPDDFIETTDPSVAEEEAYRLSLIKKKQELNVGEEEDMVDVDTHPSGNDDDDVDD